MDRGEMYLFCADYIGEPFAPLGDYEVYNLPKVSSDVVDIQGGACCAWLRCDCRMGLG